MKILYAVQATGNGHISRAMELLPYLEEYGEVDIFLSGSNSTLKLDAPVKYRSKGMSLHYTCNGELNYYKTVVGCSLRRAYKEAVQLPVEKYDLILNDFEAITSIACNKKKVPMIHFGHQASFVSDNTPRPDKKSYLGEWILKNYVKSSHNVGLHFDAYDDFIFPPVIKKEVWDAEPTNKGHITVYLPSFCDQELVQIFSKIEGAHFEIFSRQIQQITPHGNIKLIPVDKMLFNESLITCNGIITGAGFETPAEALYLRKKIIAIPIGGQYEQICNGAALAKLGALVLDKLEGNFPRRVENWLEGSTQSPVIKFQSTRGIVHRVMDVF
ncbi:MAG TPA: glycosyltransferase family protein [Arachidicoccus sp.]|nr:glycosyltransferase family protein [Arachidicoccus sp.]